MSEEPDPLAPARGFSIEGGLRSFAPVLSDGACDRVVKASVQRLKIFGADRRVRFHGQLGDGLTDIAIVVDHLRHREPLNQQVMSVLDRAFANFEA
jgi:hypothetical protein